MLEQIMSFFRKLYWLDQIILRVNPHNNKSLPICCQNLSSLNSLICWCSHSSVLPASLFLFIHFSCSYLRSHTPVPTLFLSPPRKRQSVFGEVIVMLLMRGCICSPGQSISGNWSLKSQNDLCSASPHIISTAVAAPHFVPCICLFGSGNVCFNPSVSALCLLSGIKVQNSSAMLFFILNFL